MKSNSFHRYFLQISLRDFRISQPMLTILGLILQSRLCTEFWTSSVLIHEIMWLKPDCNGKKKSELPTQLLRGMSSKNRCAWASVLWSRARGSAQWELVPQRNHPMASWSWRRTSIGTLKLWLLRYFEV